MKIALLFFAFLTLSFAQAEDLASVNIWNQITSKTEAKKTLGKPIEVAGYIVTNEFEDGEVTEFIFNRLAGGCVHVPLPPPSNLIHVVMEKVKSTPPYYKQRVVIHGTLSPGSRIDSSFEMVADSVKLLPHQ